MPNTRTKTSQARLQSGQAIVLIALLILVLFGMLGLAIDSGRAYVDRRSQQAAVDAAALSAGDYYENYQDLYNYSIPYSVQLYANDMGLYGAIPAPAHTYNPNFGPNANLPQDTYKYLWPVGCAGSCPYELDIIATNTQFNGYDFTYSSTHNLPLAFMQIFGGPTTATITATATAVVGDQRQTPALLTLSSGPCALTLTGAATLTVLGDTYTNGQACVDANLQEAGNCYAGSGNCSAATYYCYNSSPGFVPYPPPCKSGDTLGTYQVPAPALPDPGYLSPSLSYYSGLAGSYSKLNRGTWTEMPPGSYGGFHLTGGSASCAFLDPGIYVWTSGYKSDASGSLLSNELKAPDEENAAAPLVLGGGTANPQFWDLNSTGCAGHFSVAVNIAAGYGIKKGLAGGTWGVVLTSVRYDQFLDPTILPDPCLASPGCYRESTPSQCVQVTTLNIKDQVIDVSITQNAPGAQYYNVYVDPNGCENVPSNFSFINQYVAPGFTDGGGPPASWAGGAYPNGGAGIVLSGGRYGWPCAAAGHTACKITDTGLAGNSSCWALARTTHCQPPDDELGPQCFSGCPPAPGFLTQENPPMMLQFGAYTGGDEANENTCRLSPAPPGDPSAPCNTAKITPGAVQFYFTVGSCLDQNSTGATYVFSGEQYNWIVIYEQPVVPAPPVSGVSCFNTLNGSSSTQYIGTIYTPTADWKINGGNRSPLAGQVIAYTATLKGGASVGIDFNPNYAPAPPAARLIN